MPPSHDNSKDFNAIGKGPNRYVVSRNTKERLESLLNNIPPTDPLAFKHEKKPWQKETWKDKKKYA